MKNQFVTVDIALKLKDLDFNGHCIAVYEFGTWTLKYYPQGVDNNKKIHHETLAPLWQQVTYWLREEHSIHITIHVHKEGYSFNIEKINGKNGIEMLYSSIITSMTNNVYYKTYEESIKNGIEYTLEVLNK